MKASVVIPVYNGAKTISNTLHALLEQDFPKSDFEVIVVNDGSTDSTAAVVTHFSSVKLISQPNAGPAVARNTGVQVALGDIVVFLDADCVPKKNWLSEMLKPFSDPKIVGVQGRYENPIKNLMAEFVQLEIEERYEGMKQLASIDFIGSYSAAYRRETFLREGGFDEKFRAASGEDPDLSFRLFDKGHRMVFCENAVVAHFHPTSLLKYWKTKFFRAFWRVRMYSKNPTKMKGDSYTNPWLKFQIAFILAALVSGLILPVALLAGGDARLVATVALVLLGLAIVCSWPTSFFMLRKNIKVGLISFGILPVNAFLFAIGIIAGLIQKQGV
ncbi:MAG: glycosyltransferase [Candidatus Diapherotrites archaeon]|uniref:Glycosyltransferase n=1 Tax=Candidatus Iainarchaeum sp. TaxID=3101447 RepID=A0A8T4L9C9_9ARCH|nr:glycosyltransferase [Candidatus Diapherotrites archaeon]